LSTIYSNFKSMTSLQFAEYKNTMLGQYVYDQVEIRNVQEDGQVVLNGPWSDSIINFHDFCITIIQVPKEIALDFRGGQKITLEAKISRYSEGYRHFNNCDNTLVLTYLNHK